MYETTTLLAFASGTIAGWLSLLVISVVAHKIITETAGQRDKADEEAAKHARSATFAWDSAYYMAMDAEKEGAKASDWIKHFSPSYRQSANREAAIRWDNEPINLTEFE